MTDIFREEKNQINVWNKFMRILKIFIWFFQKTLVIAMATLTTIAKCFRWGSCDLLWNRWYIYDWVQNFKESMNLRRVYLYLDCSICYSQNGLRHQGKGQVTCFKSDYSFTIGCKIPRKVSVWRGLPHIMSAALAIAITGIIAKKGICKTSQKYCHQDQFFM